MHLHHLNRTMAEHLTPPRRSCAKISITLFERLPIKGIQLWKGNAKCNKRPHDYDNADWTQTSPHSAVHKGQTHIQIFPAVSASWDQIWREEYNRSTQHETKKLQKFPLRMNIWTTVIIRTIAARLFAISLNNPHYLEIEFKIWMQRWVVVLIVYFLMNCTD